MNKNNTYIYLILSGGILLLLAVAAILVMRQNAKPQTAISQPTNPEAAGPDTEVPRATLIESKSAYDEDSAVFLDVRSSNSYTAGHIPGAIHIPESEIPARLNELDPDQWIIPYCT